MKNPGNILEYVSHGNYIKPGKINLYQTGQQRTGKNFIYTN